MASQKRKRFSEIAIQTFEECSEGTYFTEDGEERPNLGKLVNDAVSQSEMCSEGYIESTFRKCLKTYIDNNTKYPKIIDFWQMTSVEAIKKISEEESARDPHFSLGVLNFASAVQVGGGAMNGATAQEESLIRTSGLYHCLSPFDDNFYVLPKRKGIYSNFAILSPSVPFFKNDDCEASHWDEPVSVDVVTMAAVNMREFRPQTRAGREMAQKLMHKRIRLVLKSFELMGTKTIILGAWGCGVFGNDNHKIAKLFYETIVEHIALGPRRFIFAIPDLDTFIPFYDCFHSASNSTSNPYSIKTNHVCQ